jgi:chloride channel 7
MQVTTASYAVWELLPIVLVGAVCGLLGAAFNTLNKWLTICRKKWYGDTWKTPYLKMAEAVLSIALVVTIFYWVPFAFPCRPLDDLPFDPAVAIPVDISWVAHQCQQPGDAAATGAASPTAGETPAGSTGEVNEMATLLLQTQEDALKQLFSRGTSTYFSLSTLACFIVIYFFSAIFIYGIAVPSGLFVPCMLIGAAVGRLTGELLKAGYAGETFGMSHISPGVYALVGAAGMLGGVTRMTISLTVIVVELSNDINLLLPIMLAILSSKLVGDRFTISLYDIHIELAGAALLRSTATSTADALNWMRSARSIMATNVQILHETDSTIGLVREMLRTTAHSGFPVASTIGDAPDRGDAQGADAPASKHCFAGLITRSKLEQLLQHKMQGRRTPGGGEGASNTPKELKRAVSRSRFSLPFRGVSVSLLDDDEKVDLRPLMDRTPYTVNENLRLYRVCRLFQTMGLRQLIVLDSASAVVGIITRKDILAAIEGKLHVLPVAPGWRPPVRINPLTRMMTPELLPIRPPSASEFVLGRSPGPPGRSGS